MSQKTFICHFPLRPFLPPSECCLRPTTSQYLNKSQITEGTGNKLDSNPSRAPFPFHLCFLSQQCVDSVKAESMIERGLASLVDSAKDDVSLPERLKIETFFSGLCLFQQRGFRGRFYAYDLNARAMGLVILHQM